MAQAMAHRGPDGQGTWSDQRVGFGFRRLAIIDLHRRSNQPLHLGCLHLVFNGEIYNYVELRSELTSLGHHFDTEGDTEVLLHAWAEWREGALDRLNGMFAFSVWDDESHRLTMAVDPFAEKPLFYCSDGERLLFASDVRALRAADPTIGIVDERAINNFLALEVMPALPETFFSDVRRLPPAHLARWEHGALSLHRYWTPQPVALPSDPTAVGEQLRGLLFDSVRLRLRSDVPVGTSLSGGVDSSAIVGVSSGLAGGHVRHAFTARFPGFARDEWSYAEEVALAAGVTEHHAVLPRVEELLDDLPALVCAQEEPFVSTSIYAQWRVMRAAREAGVIVLLDGQGADELLGGYAGIGGWALRSAGPRVALAALAGNPALAEDLAIACADGRAPRALVRRHRLRHASPYVAPELAQDAASLEPLPPDWEDAGSPLRRELLRQAFRSSLPNLCRYADRDSMAHSVEVRLPFLDRRVAELALSLPPSMVFHDGLTKRALRGALRGVVPDRVLDRREKVGYETPEQSWFHTPAARTRFAQVVLDPSLRASGRYDVAAFERDVAAGVWRDVRALWRAVNVELWLRSLAVPLHVAPQAA
ncbi:MAG TPA: asparagine synthase (glutamine-hydrolyzing) [Solirubrobacteraceae bacterium]|nr:asparagine synthase (glutamine-hydrolyzing) [Solirubrobacteraceae bacterium]